MKDKIFNIYKGKKVLVTGHTGFKGAWLTFWLYLMGAKILGVSKNVITKPSLYRTLKIKDKIRNKFLDIQDFKKLNKTFLQFKPDFVFHLAAQALVKKSFEDPRETFLTNSIVTLNILHAIKNLKNKCNAVIITSDKCYLNLEQNKGYKETDQIGGIDPYSASKASAEIIIKCYQKSFLQKNTKISFVVARAGNVVGGGDWSDNRLIPDCIKAWTKNRSVNIRNPRSTRPWQHVLEAIGAYLYIGIVLLKNKKLNGEAFNFGPSSKKNFSTREVLKILSSYWPSKSNISYLKKSKFKESNLLRLNCNKVKKKIGWSSILSFQDTIHLTAEWYETFYFNKKNIFKISKRQIDNYINKFNLKIKKL